MVRKSAIILLALLLFTVSAFSAAPSWVAQGAVLEYSVGTDTVKFTVLSSNGTDIRISIKAASASSAYTATENASADSGQFWYDSSELSSASVGADLGDFEVTGQGKQTFAGKEYDTITLEGVLDEVETTRIYEKQTGLLLKQTASAPGAPVVTLISFTPASAPAPPPPPPPPPPPANNTSQPPPSTPPSTPPAQPPSTPPSVPPSTPPSQPPSEPPPVPEEEPPEKKPITELCCPSAFILLMLGFLVIRR
jgi:hypothetical protein